MASDTEERLKELNEWIASSPEIPPSLASLTLYGILQASECLLIEAYEHTVQSGPEIPCDATGGYFEFGPVLYWLNNPDKHWKKRVDALVIVLDLIERRQLPSSKISPQLYAKIKNQAETTGIVAQDGTIYGENKYEALDPDWLEALILFLYYQAFPERVYPFGNTPQTVQLAHRGGQTRIAIVGDWGTGAYRPNGGPAVAVIDAIKSLNPQPDYLIHMGDVYYAGTEGQESGNFLKYWPADRFGGQSRENTSFTLNSNHEMYGGAIGYFKVALSAVKTPFARQKRTSYFALYAKPWLILGLDSAYYASPSTMFMQGSLGGSDRDQIGWIKKFRDSKDWKVIVLTHHNAISDDGTTREPIWNELKQALNYRPDYWYWGHIHNGIVYSSTLPAAEGAKVRCIGHGAIPYGKAWGLAKASGIDYYGNTPESSNSVRVRNGFAVLTLKSDGALDEVFYEVEDGTGKPIIAWKS